MVLLNLDNIKIKNMNKILLGVSKLYTKNWSTLMLNLENLIGLIVLSGLTAH